MGEILSNEEIDSLFPKLKERISLKKRKGKKIRKRAFHFLENLVDDIARSLSAEFKEFCGIETAVKLCSCDEMDFENFADSISSDAPLFTFGLPWTDGRIFLDFEPSFPPYLLEVLAGGTKLKCPSRFCAGTKFEKSLCAFASERMRHELQRCFGRAGCANHALLPEKIDLPRSFSVPFDSLCVLALYEVKTAGICAFFSLCFTESALMALMRRPKPMEFGWNRALFNVGARGDGARFAWLEYPFSEKPLRVAEPEFALSKIFEDQARQLLCSVITKEHPQTIALLMALAPDQAAAEMLRSLPEDIKTEAAARFAKIGAVSPEIILKLASAMVFEMQGKRILAAFSSGTNRLTNILRRADPGSEKNILEGIGEYDGVLAAELRNSLFLFEELIILDEGSVRNILELADDMDLRLALRDSSTALQEHIYHSLPGDLADRLRDDMAYSGPVRLSLVYEAQKRISEIALRLKEEGKIVFPLRPGP